MNLEIFKSGPDRNTSLTSGTYAGGRRFNVQYFDLASLRFYKYLLLNMKRSDFVKQQIIQFYNSRAFTWKGNTFMKFCILPKKKKIILI